ncbi:MAG: arginase [Planctomycetes bacterium]|nr:arginase [Planctomycetota bacterium]
MASRRAIKAPEHRDVHILGVPMDHGAGRRGVGMGPSSIRIAGLHEKLRAIGHEVTDHGDVLIRDVERAQSVLTQPTGQVGPNMTPPPVSVSVAAPAVPAAPIKGRANHLPLIQRACDATHEHVKRIVKKGGFPLVIGGDHSLAIGTISGLVAAYKEEEAEQRARGINDELTLGVIWVDAHGDLNTPETSPSGNVHGMPLSCVLGMGPKELTHIGGFSPKVFANDVVLVGLRDLDRMEKAAILDSGVHAFTMKDIDERGLAAVMREAINLATRNTDYFHVSFDIDSVDPRNAPGTGTTVAGGLTYREAHLAMEMFAESGMLTSLELVEVNPILDVYNQTGQLAVELIASALGKTIL